VEEVVAHLDGMAVRSAKVDTGFASERAIAI
jgi:hypothetical protein